MAYDPDSRTHLLLSLEWWPMKFSRPPSNTLAASAGPGEVLLCLFVSALLLLVGYLGLQRPWTPSEQIFSGSDLQLFRGRGETGADGVTVQAAEQDAIIIGVAGLDLPATTVTSIEWLVEGLDPRQVPQLLWVSDINQRRTHSQRLIPTADRYRVTTNELDPWQGRIHTLGLLIQGQPPRSIRISALHLQTAPPGIYQLLRQLWQDWTAFEGFMPYSINYVVGDGHRVPVTLVTATGLWAGLALLLWCGTQWWRRRHPALLPSALILLIGWLVLDARWLWDLQRQLQLSQALFAGKTSDQKRRAEPGPAGASYRFAKAVLGEIDPIRQPRIFIFSSQRYWRYRLNYFLLPYNTVTVLGNPANLRPGDIIVIHDSARISGVLLPASFQAADFDADYPLASAGTPPPIPLPPPGIYAAHYHLTSLDSTPASALARVVLRDRSGNPRVLLSRRLRVLPEKPVPPLVFSITPSMVGTLEFQLHPASSSLLDRKVSLESLPPAPGRILLLLDGEKPIGIARRLIQSPEGYAFRIE